MEIRHSTQNEIRRCRGLSTSYYYNCQSSARFASTRRYQPSVKNAAYTCRILKQRHAHETVKENVQKIFVVVTSFLTLRLRSYDLMGGGIKHDPLRCLRPYTMTIYSSRLFNGILISERNNLG